MARLKISQLPAVDLDDLTGPDVLPIVNDSETKRVTLSDIASFTLSDVVNAQLATKADIDGSNISEPATFLTAISDLSQLTAASDVEDTDLVGVFRSTGPIKKLTIAAIQEHLTTSLAEIDGANITDDSEFRTNIGAASQADVDDLQTAVDNLETAQSSGYVGYVTWAELEANVTQSDGAVGTVFGPDAGTHTDPVVGGTVANEGAYRWSASPAGWERVGNTMAADAAASAEEAEDWAIEAQGYAEIIPLSAVLPNKFLPEEIQGTDLDGWVVTNGTLERVIASDGLPAFKLTANPGLLASAYKEFDLDIYNGNTVSTALRVLEVDAAPAGSMRHRSIWRNSSTQLGFETVTIVGSAGLTFDAARAPTTLEDKTPTALSTIHWWYVDLSQTGDPTNPRECLFREILSAEGASAAFRPAAPVTLSITTPQNVWVSSSGSDSNAGTEAAPFATIAAAVAAIEDGGGYGEIRFPQDVDMDITENTIDVSGIRRARLVMPREGTVRFVGGTTVTGWSATGGYTGVYESVVSSLLMTAVNMIYQDELPDFWTTISAGERHSLQRGLTTRLPMTRLFPVNSIAEVEASLVPAWYHDGTKLYVKIDDGTGNMGDDPTGYTIKIPGATHVFTGGNGLQDIELNNIQSFYHRRSIWTYQWAKARLVECSAFGSRDDGIRLDDTRVVEMIRCRSSGNGNDGFNQHGLSGTGSFTTVAWDSWASDNYDDGQSLHEFCNGTFFGGLLEYNGDRGDATCCGAHTTHHNSYARFNGLIESNGEGFCAIGDATDSGVGTSSILYNCISEGNTRNFGVGVGSTTGARLVAYNPKSINPQSSRVGTVYHYDATNNGTMDLYDATFVGSGTEKGESSGGVINVNTTGVLT